MSRPICCLTIAGSDSGGGAGIQADLKAFARCGVHGMSALTALTAQNTVAVSEVLAVPPETITAQIAAVADDMPIDAIKIGMVGAEPAITAVAAALDSLAPGIPIVLDPVMIAESGARLLDEGAERALVTELLPRATVVTPNIPEARVLAAHAPEPPPADADGELLARAVIAAGARALVLTGGHRDEAVDIVIDSADDGPPLRLPGPRHADGAAHGSGCTHAAVLAASLARGRSLADAATAARRLAGEAVEHGLRGAGKGAGPVHVLGPVLRVARREQ